MTYIITSQPPALHAIPQVSVWRVFYIGRVTHTSQDYFTGTGAIATVCTKQLCRL